MQSTLSIYRNPSGGMTSTSAAFAAAGSAYSANGLPFFGGLITRRLKYAQWSVAWTPSEAGGDIRIVDVWNGNALIADAVPIPNYPYTGAQNWGADVTAQLNAIIDGKLNSYLLMEMKAPAIVYCSDIHCIWS